MAPVPRPERADMLSGWISLFPQGRRRKKAGFPRLANHNNVLPTGHPADANVLPDGARRSVIISRLPTPNSGKTRSWDQAPAYLPCWRNYRGKPAGYGGRSRTPDPARKPEHRSPQPAHHPHRAAPQPRGRPRQATRGADGRRPPEYLRPAPYLSPD